MSQELTRQDCDDIEALAAQLLVAAYSGAKGRLPTLIDEVFVLAEEFYAKRDRWRASMASGGFGTQEKTPAQGGRRSA